MSRLLLLLLCAGIARAQDVPVFPSQTPMPINLPTVLALGHAAPLDIAIATKRVQAAAADLDRAHVLWLPTLSIGGDYFRHDGQLQDIVGKVFTTSRSAVMAGVGPTAVFAVTDAIYSPLTARQELRARESETQAARDESTLRVALAYFDVQRARGEVAGSLEAVKRGKDLAERAAKLAPGLVPAVEVNRARNELLRRKLAVESAYERWQVASAELARLLRLTPTTLVVPIEPPQMRVSLLDGSLTIDTLVTMALTHRPELSAHQALVQATLARLQQEKLRPLLPSLLLRGNATNPAGNLSTGVFGGGINGSVGNFSMRNSVDVQLIWELQNLGLGNRALVRRRSAENEEATLRLFRLQDQVAAEVVQAHARADRAKARAVLAEEALREAQLTVDKTLEGLGQTKRAGDMLLLVFRPQEAVAAVTALDQGYRDYYAAISDANRAEFQLYRAVGQPAQELMNHFPVEPGVTNLPPAKLPLP